jgi:V8-like Glu-specific endopeptidase
MKRIAGLLLGFVFCIQAMAQIECEGTPMPFRIPTQTLQRSATIFFQTIDIDTTQTLINPERGLAIGHVAQVNYHTDYDGFWEEMKNGDRIWRIGFVSKGAASMSLVLSQLDIPNGAKIFIYNPTQTQVLGAFGSENLNEQGILPIRPLQGDSLIIEYQEPAQATYRGSFCIERVAHNRSTNQFNSSNLCSPHALLTNELPQQKQAVCLLYIVSSTQSYYGSGCLINNAAGKPYVYTAAHNFKSEDDATRTIFYFNYAVTAQDSTIQGTQECSIGGSTMRAYATDIDMALVELNQMPPKDYRPYLAGWNRSKSPQAPLTSIQHPKGDSKRMSFANNNPTISNYTGYLVANQIKKGWWYIDRWNKGCTEAGSSGSPLFDKEGLIIGALTGGNSTCSKPVSDYYARLDTAWNHHAEASRQLAHWLSPQQPEKQYMVGADPYAPHPCRRISHINNDATITAAKMNQGYYAGHNKLQHTQFAEKFTLDKKGHLYGAYIMPFTGKYKSNAPVYLTVYSGNDYPTTQLAKIQVKPHDLTCTRSGTWGTAIKSNWAKKENYIHFETPIPVPPTFFVGIEIQYNNITSVDTLALYACTSSTNYAYYKEGNTWKPYSSHSIQPCNLSLWIEPVCATEQAVGINTTEVNTNVVYPNPTPNCIYWEGDSSEYRLYSLQGKLIAKGCDNKVMVPQPGIYLLHILGDKPSIHKVIRY